MGCAVQIYQRCERSASWGAKAINRWYLQMSPEHYQCHVMYVKQTKSERVSDTVFFKTKYITQPTLTQANVISKALSNLTHALKGKSNQKVLEQIEALTKLDNILNNVPETAPPQSKRATQEQWRVLFDATTKPPKATETRDTMPTPRASKPNKRTRAEPIHTATINKPIPKAATPRVQNTKPSKRSHVAEWLSDPLSSWSWGFKPLTDSCLLHFACSGNSDFHG